MACRGGGGRKRESNGVDGGEISRKDGKSADRRRGGDPERIGVKQSEDARRLRPNWVLRAVDRQGGCLEAVRAQGS